jgi:hypothetical protein
VLDSVEKLLEATVAHSYQFKQNFAGSNAFLGNLQLLLQGATAPAKNQLSRLCTLSQLYLALLSFLAFVEEGKLQEQAGAPHIKGSRPLQKAWRAVPPESRLVQQARQQGLRAGVPQDRATAEAA